MCEWEKNGGAAKRHPHTSECCEEESIACHPLVSEPPGLSPPDWLYGHSHAGWLVFRSFVFCLEGRNEGRIGRGSAGFVTLLAVVALALVAICVYAVILNPLASSAAKFNS